MTKTKTKKPSVVTSKQVLEKKLTDDQLRIRILKTELHYFKGLAIMVVLMTVCVFVAFGVLFSAMYIETRATRLVIEKAMGEILPKNFVATDDSKAETQDLASPTQTTDDTAETPEATAKIKWLFFEKYGYRVYFPNSWTFLDKPFQKQIYFFSDGEVRENDSEDIGNFVTAIVDKDNYRDKYSGELVSAAGTVGISYSIGEGKKSQTIVVVPFGAKYLEIRSNKNDPTLTSDLMKAMVAKIEFVK
ncbi:MAG: hypothetical protein AAB575_00105 [Patescibacteria group bacterium]